MAEIVHSDHPDPCPPQGSLLGNALDKGGGGGAYADHFGMCCGMEVVLPDGEIMRTGMAEHLIARHAQVADGAGRGDTGGLRSFEL